MFVLDFSWWRRLLTGWRISPAPPQHVPANTVSSPAASPNDIFTPTQPRSGRRTLVGREQELSRILDAITEENAHIVLYSERGRGKTSLSNLAVERLRRRGAVVARCACEAETNFESMLRMLMRDVPSGLLRSGVGRGDTDGCESILPERIIRPADVAAIPGYLECQSVVLVIDEFDRVTDPETRTRLADTIKTVSDRGLRLFFMVVGVSETLEQIIGQHPSIQRNIVGIHLPLLTDDEVAEMLFRGGRQAGIDFNDSAVSVVQDVARGMPYMAQLLGLRIAQAALRRSPDLEDRPAVCSADVLSAVDRLIAEANSSVISSYASMTGHAHDGIDAATLLRLADAEQDRWGRMIVSRNATHVLVGGCRVLQTQFSRLLQANILVQSEGDTGPAQFRDRALIYHVLLLAARTRLLGEDADETGKFARLRA